MTKSTPPRGGSQASAANHRERGDTPYQQALSSVTVAESKGLLPTGTYKALLDRLSHAEAYIPARDFEDYLGDAGAVQR